jgi:quercetin dioxygenase-like cupin family protein
MIFCKFEEAEPFETSEGVMRPIFASEKIAITHLEIPAGLEVKPHSHPGDGVLILIDGSIKLISEAQSS